MQLSKVFARKGDDTFGAKDTEDLFVEKDIKWDIPKKAKHIQFRVTEKKTPESIPFYDSCVIYDDFKDCSSLTAGHVQLLWW